MGVIKNKNENFETEYDPNFRAQYIDGAVGVLNSNGGRIAFFVEVPQIETGSIPAEGPTTGPELSVNTVKRIFVADIRMSPENYKSIAQWMKNNVDTYEKSIQTGMKTTDVHTPSGYQ